MLDLKTVRLFVLLLSLLLLPFWLSVFYFFSFVAALLLGCVFCQTVSCAWWRRTARRNGWTSCCPNAPSTYWGLLLHLHFDIIWTWTIWVLDYYTGMNGWKYLKCSHVFCLHICTGTRPDTVSHMRSWKMKSLCSMDRECLGSVVFPSSVGTFRANTHVDSSWIFTEHNLNKQQISTQCLTTSTSWLLNTVLGTAGKDISFKCIKEPICLFWLNIKRQGGSVDSD